MWAKTQWGKKKDLMDRNENSKSIKVGTAVATKEITRRVGEADTKELLGQTQTGTIALRKASQGLSNHL